MKYFYTFISTAFFFFHLSAQTITTSVINPPSQLRCSDVPVKLNNIVFGSIPPNAADNPVVVFIHGWFDNGYGWFLGKNKWYEDAYNGGYRTAFFFQSYSDAFEDNGRVIAKMIRETCRHYNTDKVVAVCHSKGGYDIEFALYNENMWDSVQGVITLSTPFWGAPMSDMIATPVIRSFLESVPIVGPIFQGKGSYQMQTAYMAGVVRPMMDNNPDNRPEKFHCFATWGNGHTTVFPPEIPDDILKVVFPDYNPSCIEIPGFGTLAGNLITGLMNIIGDLSHLVQVQGKYNNPQKNQIYMDGLAPYYSSLRPGSVVLSQSPPSQQSFLNHMDALLSSNMWGIVQQEIDYFKNHPVFRKKNTALINAPSETQSFQPSSDMQLVQSASIELNASGQIKLYLAGEYKNKSLRILDENNQLVKIITLNFSTLTMFDIFHEVDLSSLPSGKKYTLQSDVPLVGFIKDGNAASMQINTHSDKTYYASEPLGLEVSLSDWTDNVQSTFIKGFLNRNIDDKGNVIWDKIIPVSFVYDEGSKSYVCRDKMELADGVYNLSVFADGNSLHRFGTTSILVKQERIAKGFANPAFSIYPNPANALLTIQFTADEAKNYSVEMFDIVGREIAKVEAGRNISGIQNMNIPLKEFQLSQGSYLISLTENGERKGSKVVVIN
jgi:pimeloyl-ACP methyl ester carboxylesterase